MPVGYLENNYLEELSDELGADMDASGATTALTPAPGDVANQPPADVVRIGSLVIKRSTLYLTILVVLVVAVFLSSKKKRRADA